MDPQRSIFKPKIRVVHVFSPEIIKTDPANFRELVQRLTGKPAKKLHDVGGARRRRKKKARTVPAAAMTTEAGGAGEIITGNSGGSSSPSFLSGLGDDDGDEFFHGLAGELPLLPLMSFSCTQAAGE
ncbi:hypothetical protein KSP39_PZI023057 [Platanthera zijinensis]|uniref:VQ domain-containing protein n=1 Tax=Platanthera zijinensis TaxID=2320716 RepID=A0AAP0FV95_9ASPA